MSDFLIASLIFCCGTAVGFIAAALIAIGKREELPEAPEFDGGYRDHNAPPVRTVIWSKHINSEENK